MNDNGSTERKMPKYKCHKEVRALQIRAVITLFDGGQAETGEQDIVFKELDYDKVRLSAEFVKKHNPKVGDYYVVYKDGYKSISPAKAFEDGYALKPHDEKDETIENLLNLVGRSKTGEAIVRDRVRSGLPVVFTVGGGRIEMMCGDNQDLMDEKDLQIKLLKDKSV